MIKVITSIHGQKAIEIRDTTPAQHKFMRELLSSPWCQDVRYQVRRAANAFFQCGATEESGYILIEFWTNDDKAIDAFVQYVNDNLPKG